jgi:hypothetical protein
MSETLGLGQRQAGAQRLCINSFLPGGLGSDFILVKPGWDGYPGSVLVRRFSCIVALLAGLAASACGQGTLFTYQGRLMDAGAPAAGQYDLEFRLFDQAAGGTQQGGSLARTGVWVTNGLFSVELDFGSEPFAVDALWLEIGVRKTGAAGGFALLAPRQRLTTAPFAIRAASASSYAGPVSDQQLSTNVALRHADQRFSGSVQFSNAAGEFSGSFAGDGAGLSNIAASALLLRDLNTNEFGSVTGVFGLKRGGRLPPMDGLALTNLPSGRVYNARVFGAAGDGVADDTAALQATLDAWYAGGGGTVYLPAGLYRVTETLHIPASASNTWHVVRKFRLMTDGLGTTWIDGRAVSNRFVMQFYSGNDHSSGAPSLSNFEFDGLGILGPAWNGKLAGLGYAPGRVHSEGDDLAGGGCLNLSSASAMFGGYSTIRNCAFMLHRVGLAVTNYVNLTVENCWNAGALRHGFIFHHVDNLALRDSWYGNGIDEAAGIMKTNFYGVVVVGTAIPGVIENCEGRGNFLWGDRSILTIKAIDIEGACTNSPGIIVLTNQCRTLLDSVKFNWQPFGTDYQPATGYTNGINIRCENGGNADLTLIHCYGNSVLGQAAPNQSGIWFFIRNTTGNYASMMPRLLSRQNLNGLSDSPDWTNAIINGRWCNVPEYARSFQPPRVERWTQLQLHGCSVPPTVTRLYNYPGQPYANGILQFVTNNLCSVAWQVQPDCYTNLMVRTKWAGGAEGAYPYTFSFSLKSYECTPNGAQMALHGTLTTNVTLATAHAIQTLDVPVVLVRSTTNLIYQVIETLPASTHSPGGPQSFYLVSGALKEGPW